MQTSVHSLTSSFNFHPPRRRLCRLLPSLSLFFLLQLVVLSSSPSYATKTCAFLNGQTFPAIRHFPMRLSRLELERQRENLKLQEGGEPPVVAARPCADPETAGVISYREAAVIVKRFRDKGPGVYKDCISLDLGRSRVPFLEVTADGIRFPDMPPGVMLCSLEALEDICRTAMKKKQYCCFALDRSTQGGDPSPSKISFLSEKTNRIASLVMPPPGSPSTEWPSMTVGGFPMHRVSMGKRHSEEMVGPREDTEAKIAAVENIRPLRGGSRVLDTCTGLGYTAICAASKVGGGKRGEEGVVTVEFDPAVVEVQRRNPWSSELFGGKEETGLSRLEGDAATVVRSLPSGSFSHVIHDPPSVSLQKSEEMGGSLYSEEFYAELRRILHSSDGALFHYIGDPQSRASGRLYTGVMARLQRVGFQKLEVDNKAWGVTACVRTQR
uniref:Methyltransferase domain-containing protein n=1 Tax=Chromera velia CCMP2878 TaxID=1169474 RepID=A0A0G4I0A8_9ALVE|eukprot:Cvel_9889.t1-p1 / transcript=Cvel_9889.t1 / gene=Cvel_9889 / organism=Chromera_velia_CCMP2878 / gene_product=Uncharacterized protein MJ1233, putative / transcript_product=Uncharacterized protein MJ1233, putative / location=Cvel_scaffold583:60846-62447(-) / protein_length=439 / sequence_SO=supercontig / SO=protein_coding / is_pseudo=false